MAQSDADRESEIARMKAMVLMAIDKGRVDVPITFINRGFGIEDAIIEPDITILMQLARTAD